MLFVFAWVHRRRLASVFSSQGAHDVVRRPVQGLAMIRFPVFMVLGPLGGYFAFIGLRGGIKGDSAGVIFGMLLPVAWIAGLVPTSTTAALDRLFKRLGARSVQR
jgi:hypothetical protein